MAGAVTNKRFKLSVTQIRSIVKYVNDGYTIDYIFKAVGINNQKSRDLIYQIKELHSKELLTDEERKVFCL